ncbi:MAG: hypothetical protein ACLRWH_14215 [Emergencia sp.]
MNSLRSKLIEQLVLIILSVRLLFTLYLSIFFQNFLGIGQGPCFLAASPVWEECASSTITAKRLLSDLPLYR